MCRCNGEITYAPELFDGYVYTVPSAESAYKVAASSTWKCGTDQSGKPYAVDPAPWHVKHCCLACSVFRRPCFGVPAGGQGMVSGSFRTLRVIQEG